MSTEEAKRSINGGLPAKPIPDDRKFSPASASAAKKIIIKTADMKDDMQKEAVDIAIAAFEKHNVEKDVAAYIKKEFDKRHGPTWHCIIGRNFDNPLQPFFLIRHFFAQIRGSHVTHETKPFLYFYLDQKAILLFNSG